MGGTLEAKSELGEGSMFSFTIPFEAAQAQLMTPRAREAPRPTRARGR
jgi:hypothetical protein